MQYTHVNARNPMEVFYFLFCFVPKPTSSFFPRYFLCRLTDFSRGFDDYCENRNGAPPKGLTFERFPPNNGHFREKCRTISIRNAVQKNINKYEC